MAKNKKSFLLYTDVYHTVKILSDEQAGKLFKHILGYVNDENPETDDLVTNISFEPIKQSLKRDLIKYEGYINKQRINGAKGGRPKKTQKTQPLISKPKKPDSVSVSVNVSVNDNVILNKKEKEKLIDRFGKKDYEWLVNKLSFYKMSSGKEYKSDYGAINSWVIKELKKEKDSVKKENSTANEKLNEALKPLGL